MVDNILIEETNNLAYWISLRTHKTKRNKQVFYAARFECHSKRHPPIKPI